MKKSNRFRRARVKPIWLAMAALGCTACTSNVTTGAFDDGVSQAYNSSSIVDVPQYNRSIFSSTNF